jgi:hypothetical protein
MVRVARDREVHHLDHTEAGSHIAIDAVLVGERGVWLLEVPRKEDALLPAIERPTLLQLCWDRSQKMEVG